MNDRTDLTEDRLAAELATGLTALADSPAPLGRTDTAWAIRQGRSRLRRRRLGVLGAVTAVALGASVLGATLPDRGPGGPVKAATGPAAADSVLPALGPDTGRDPLTIAAAFGWLPDGFTAVDYTIGFTGSPTMFSGQIHGPAQTNPQTPFNRQILTLSVYDPGEVPPLGTDHSGRQLHRVDAPAVNGRPAYWVGIGPDDPRADESGYQLRWQAADGRWLQLRSAYMSAADGATDTIHRVAEGVTTGRQAVRLPFTLRDVPAGLTPAGVSLKKGPAAANGFPWFTTIIYSAGDQGTISFDLWPDTPVTPTGPGADGGQVTGGAKVPGECTVTAGMHMCAFSFQDEGPFAQVGGFTGWLDRFTPLGNDPARWTTDVLR